MTTHSWDTKNILVINLKLLLQWCWPGYFASLLHVLILLFIVLSSYIYIIWPPSSIVIKNGISLTLVLLVFVWGFPHISMPGLEFIVTTSLCEMISTIKKIFKYLIYSILCFKCFYHDGICGSLAHAVTTSAERPWKCLISACGFLLSLDMVNPGIAAAWKLSQTGHTRDTGNYTLGSSSLHLVTKSWMWEEKRGSANIIW